MLYGEGIREVDAAIGDASLATAIAFEAAAAAILTKTMNTPGNVRAFGFRPTVTFNYDTMTAQGVLTLYKYPAGVSGNKVALGTLKLVNGYVAGKIYFISVSSAPADTSPSPDNPAKYNAGDQLVIEITTAATGDAGIAGDFQPLIWVHDRGENVSNQGQLVQCAS